MNAFFCFSRSQKSILAGFESWAVQAFWSSIVDGTGWFLMGVTRLILSLGENHDTSSAWELDLLQQGDGLSWLLACG